MEERISFIFVHKSFPPNKYKSAPQFHIFLLNRCPFHDIFHSLLVTNLRSSHDGLESMFYFVMNTYVKVGFRIAKMKIKACKLPKFIVKLVRVLSYCDELRFI